MILVVQLKGGLRGLHLVPAGQHRERQAGGRLWPHQDGECYIDTLNPGKYDFFESPTFHQNLSDELSAQEKNL